MIPIKNIPALDGLRGIAILMVIADHLHSGSSLPSRCLVQIGRTGVDLFFVLSGFLITRILLTAPKGEGAWEFFRRFYRNRCLRILPLFLIYTTLYFFAITPLVNHKPIPSFQNQIFSWIFLLNITETFPATQHLSAAAGGIIHFWSVCVEEQYYLLWPVVVYFVSRGDLKKIVVSILMVSILSRAILIFHHLGISFFTLTRMDGIGFGALLATIWMEYKPRVTKYQCLTGVSLCLFALGAMALIFGIYSWRFQLFQNTLVCLTYFCIVGFCVFPNSPQAVRMFENSFLRWTGKLSYGLYVFHPFCISCAYQIFPNSFILKILAALGFSGLVAALSFRYFETPFLNLKYAHFSKQKVSPPTSV